ncbi:uncharacterized protein LOC119954370 isoform X2 [Scyliorhinus canicula]|uniref:uncharacterized protein LOC119954370 isoform X2 n=1 Tax=Scyliorhinus canicula TaxID=7830 RepID=UPI0018F3F662|nr:uncharacterized protein LOC119954370 isoform X2 [Scyliorhinus canicula]
MFHKATRKIVKEIDPYGFTLIPAASPYYSDCYKPLNIIKKKKRAFFFMKDRYIPTSITVADILEDGKDLDFGLGSSSFSGYSASSQISVSGEVGAKAGVAANVQQELSFPGGTTIAFKVSKLRITRDNTLDVDWEHVVMSRQQVSSHERPKIPLTEINTMSKETSLLFLNTFLEILGNCDYLPVLDTMLDQICGSLQPDLQVLDRMEDENRACVEKLLDLLGIRKADPPGQPLTLTPRQNGIIKTVNIFIESLNELNPDVLILLANSVEMKIISIQMKLFEKIEENFFLSTEPRMEMKAIGEVQETEETMETLALQLSDKGFEITQRILEEFELHLMNKNGSISYEKDYGDRNVFFSIFAALSILSALDK